MASLLNSEISFEDVEKRLSAILNITGTDTEDRIYENLMDMWNFELDESGIWYKKAYDYWENESNCPENDDGVLGGYGFLTEVDCRDSNLFLDHLIKIDPELSLQRAADCGAGIGRVVKHFLLPRFSQVDLVEQSPRLLQYSQKYIGEESSRTSLICQNMKDFQPEPGTYDLIWIQWVIGHLHDLDFIRFFQNCGRGLTEHGVIVLKDNCCNSSDWTFVVDKADSSLSRSPEYMKLLFDMAGMKVIACALQRDLPSELSNVYMFAVVPASRNIRSCTGEIRLRDKRKQPASA